MKTLVLLATAAVMLVAPVTADASNLGMRHVYAPTAKKAKGVAHAYRFKAHSTTAVDRLNFYLDRRSSARKVQLGLYSGTASHARKRQARCMLVHPRRNAWNQCRFAPVIATAGRYYWLATLQPSFSGGRMRYRERKTTRGAMGYVSRSRRLGSLPSRWKSGARRPGRYRTSMFADQAQAVPTPFADPVILTPPSLAAPTPSPVPTTNPPATATPTATPAATATPAPTATPSATATPAPTATPSATPTPSPSVTPSPSPSPSVTPSPGVFPDASSTGVPVGTSLSAYTGPATITTAGTVIDGKTMGCIKVAAAGVVIRNSRISCATSGYALYAGDGSFSGTPLLVEDSEVTCSNTNGTGIGEALLTIRRVEITGCENGVDLNQNVLIEDSFIHDLASVGTDPHEDGVQLAWGRIENGQVVEGAKNITLRHSTVYGINANGSFGTSAMIVNGTGKDTDILVENNLLAGGAFTIYCERGAPGINFQVKNNRFSTKFKSTVGYYGIADGCADEQLSGNVINETGLPALMG